ncbi:hypothetical protein [Sporosarcina sp. NPDC096371]
MTSSLLDILGVPFGKSVVNISPKADRKRTSENGGFQAFHTGVYMKENG